MSFAPQSEFRLVAELPPGRPLVPLAVAAFFLDTDHAGVIGRMEEGIISHAWDIGTGVVHRELRFYWKALLFAKQSAVGGVRSEVLADEVVYADVIPTNWQRPRASLLYRRWACSADLMADLIAAGELRAVTEAHRGETGSPEVLRTSAIEFLQRRRCV